MGLRWRLVTKIIKMAKNKQPPKKTRFEALSVDLGEKDINPASGMIELNFEFNMINGTSRAINAATGQEIENKGLVLGYQGENKWRPTTYIPGVPGDNSYDLQSKIEKYKHLVAIDTNTISFFSTRFHRDIKISLGIGLVLNYDANKVQLDPINRPFLTTPNCEKPENENWVRVIELLRSSCQCTDPRKIGIIVDSDLGNIEAYNKRTLPVFANYFLPDEYELIFASDKVKDNIFNKMIGACHAISKDLLTRHVESVRKKIDEEDLS